MSPSHSHGPSHSLARATGRALLAECVRTSGQVECARRLGCSQPLVSAVLRGTRVVSLDLLVELLAVSHGSADAVLGLGPPRWDASPAWPAVLAAARAVAPDVSLVAWARVAGLRSAPPARLDALVVAQVARMLETPAS